MNKLINETKKALVEEQAKSNGLTKHVGELNAQIEELKKAKLQSEAEKTNSDEATKNSAKKIEELTAQVSKLNQEKLLAENRSQQFEAECKKAKKDLTSVDELKISLEEANLQIKQLTEENTQLKNRIR